MPEAPVSSAEQAALEAIYAAYSKIMYHLALRIVGNPYDAEDALQQAFIKLAENIEKIDAPISPRTKQFAITIVQRKAIDICQAKARHHEIPLTEDHVNPLAESDLPMELTRCITKLNPRYRSVLILKYIYGFSYKEISAILGTSTENVYKLGQRARVKLLQLCKEAGLL